MKKFLCFIFAVLLISAGYAWGDNYTLEGEMGSHIRFNLERQLKLYPDLEQITLSFVIPQAFSSQTGKQGVEDFKLSFSPSPDKEKRKSDLRGNQIVESTWVNPPETIDVKVQFNGRLDTDLKRIDTTAAFPMGKIPDDVRYYLTGTKLVQKDHPRIAELASSLTKGAETQYDAVGRIMAYVVDKIHYVNPSEKYDAVYTLEQGKGNCQNFSHLNAALMRSLGIPVRIVNGITLNKPFQIVRSQGEITVKMGQGRHSWIEVWFPDLGWVPFDQQTAMFVPNRHIRIEVGIDNNETIHDGSIRWSQKKGTQGEPGLKEIIHADFTDDQFRFVARKEPFGPKNFLLAPHVKAELKKSETLAGEAPAVTKQIAAKPKEDRDAVPTQSPPAASEQKKAVQNTAQASPGSSVPATEREKKEPVAANQSPLSAPTPPERKDKGTLSALFEDLWAYVQSVIRMGETEKDGQTKISHKSEGISISDPSDIKNTGYDASYLFGNLQFPEDIDFAFPPAPVTQKEDGTFEKVRTFWTETAEYVTNQRNQYCQLFIVKRAMKLEKIGLALHYFGGEGQLWVDLYGNDQGKPGKVIATSQVVDSTDVSTRPGYRWMDFNFKSESLILPPGAYWLGLGFTGTPIVNWFYSYGKPVGPAEGTRYKGIYEAEWSGALSFEFNYRIMGLQTRD
jgi:transglutaminase-like putative cysteine protease